MLIETILQDFDTVTRTGFDEGDVNDTIADALKDMPDLPMELEAEKMAFRFKEDYSDRINNSVNYFGPVAVWTGSDGLVYAFPSISLLTPEIILYYSQRALACSNPILIARYAGLVFDFHLAVCGKKAPHSIAVLYINSLLAIANGKYSSSNIGIIRKLKRALDLSLSLNKNDLIIKCKDAILDFECLGDDYSPGLWGNAFKWLVGNKKVGLSESEESGIIETLEKRLQRLVSETDLEKLSPHKAEYAAFPLAGYYYKKKATADLERVLTCLQDAYERISSRATAMQMDFYLNRMYEAYAKYQLNSHSEKLLIKIRSLGPKKRSEMGTIPFEFSIPAETTKKFSEIIMQGEGDQPLQQLAAEFIPSKETARKELADSAKKYPLSHLFRKQLQDSQGRTITELKSYDDDPEGHLIHHINQNLTIYSVLLIPTVSTGILSGKISTELIMDYLSKTPVIKTIRKPLFELALNNYFNKQYTVFLHIVIPQIEDTLRNIVEKINGNVLKPIRSGGHHLRTFDDILRDDALNKVLGEDLSNYFRVLFTDQRGWNLRNNICHGMTEPKDFNALTATWVLHALLCLGLIKPAEN